MRKEEGDGWVCHLFLGVKVSGRKWETTAQNAFVIRPWQDGETAVDLEETANVVRHGDIRFIWLMVKTLDPKQTSTEHMVSRLATPRLSAPFLCFIAGERFVVEFPGEDLGHGMQVQSKEPPDGWIDVI